MQMQTTLLVCLYSHAVTANYPETRLLTCSDVLLEEEGDPAVEED